MPPQRQPYKGPQRKLVLAFDVGVTQSSVSYCILVPGQVPEIKSVTRFPGQETVGAAHSIPTIIYYDQAGKVRAVGAEAAREEIFDQAVDEGWVKSEWFKLHLRPSSGQASSPGIPPLPLGMTVVEVMADFLTYLFQCSSQYIREIHGYRTGNTWNTLQRDIEFVLSHPNGWTATQQSQMRRAAATAGLVPDTEEGQARISFCTEGETSLYYAIESGVPLRETVEKDEAVVIVDARGDVINISTYTHDIKESSSGGADIDTFWEEGPPQCHFQGSVFVTVHARLYLEAFLADSKFIDDVDHIVRCFHKTTMPRFRSDKDMQYIKFGSTRDNDPEHNVRFGQLRLHGETVAGFFEGPIKCIVDYVAASKQNSHKPIKRVVLVGAFARNEWLFQQVQERLRREGAAVIRPDSRNGSSMDDDVSFYSAGAISFYLEHQSARPDSPDSRMYHGPPRNVSIDVQNIENLAQILTLLSGNGHNILINIGNNNAINGALNHTHFHDGSTANYNNAPNYGNFHQGGNHIPNEQGPKKRSWLGLGGALIRRARGKKEHEGNSMPT